MWIQSDFPYPVSSFPEPVLPPGSDPESYPLICVQFNATWQGYILGCLMQLCNPATWKIADRAHWDIVLDYATRLIELFAVAEICTTMLLRFQNCELQLSTDGGTTWTTVSGWMTGFPLCVVRNTAQLVMTPGLSSPPVPVWTPDGTDWVYAPVPMP